ncbi:MAG: hypothetical protein OSJ60_21975 [Lachnospiraceae bacterium]|nr:hypothetical protein [Lachnospiraceae bacterium]
MQKFNNNTRIIIGVDHGYGNMKTAHRVFRTGVECMEEEPIVSKNFVKYKDKFYVIGESHLVYQGNKTDSEDFYILTLAALAEELKFRGLHEARDSLNLILRRSRSRVVRGGRFSDGKDSTSVITALMYTPSILSQVVFSFDLAILAKDEDGTYYRLIHDKRSNNYHWGGSTSRPSYPEKS